MGNNVLPTADDLNHLHEQVLYTQVRVRVDQGGGSGTIIYSKPNADGGFSTYALTCHHVIDSALKVRKEWDPKAMRDRKREYRQLCNVEFFDWSNVLHGRRPVNYSTDADIVAYDKDHDMALLKLRTVKAAPYVAELLPATRIKELRIGSPTRACGAALLHDPVLTRGEITHMGDEIDFKPYYMSSAQIIFGNSGGAMFYEDAAGYYFIGVPSRIAIAGWSAPITHMGYFSPIGRVYEFFKEQMFDFLDPLSVKTEAECEVSRKAYIDRESRGGDEADSAEIAAEVPPRAR